MFALQFARKALAEPEIPGTTYDPDRQVSVLTDGTPACRDRELMLASGTTASTAGSKTHFDD